MSPRVFRALAAIGLLLGLWLAAAWYFSDEHQIRRRLARIQRLVAKAPTESELTGFGKARAIAELFAEPFQLSADSVGASVSDRQTLISSIHGYRSRSSTLVMEVSGEQIFLAADGDGANSFFTVRFLNDLGDLRGAETYDVRIHWRRQDGAWLIGDVLVSSAPAAP